MHAITFAEPGDPGVLQWTEVPDPVARPGEVVLVSKANSWQAYYWWLDDALAPSYARTVDIHRKPGVPFNTLIGKMKDKSVNPAYLRTESNKRFAGNYESNSSAMVFRYDLIGVQLPLGYESSGEEDQDNPYGVANLYAR